MSRSETLPRVPHRAAALIAVAASVSGLAVSANAPAHLAASPASSGHLRVAQVEYRLLLSRGVVKAGPVSLEAIDRGTIPHDLRLQAQGSSSELALPELRPGGRWSGTVRLRAGVYRLWCSLPEHARLGMQTTLRVVS